MPNRLLKSICPSSQGPDWELRHNYFHNSSSCLPQQNFQPVIYLHELVSLLYCRQLGAAGL